MNEIASVKKEVKLAQWKEMVRSRSESGLTLIKWCRQNGINTASISRHITISEDTLRRLLGVYEIAVAWKRLIEGDFYDCDILLLEHELFETTYYNYFHDVNNCTISEAHNFAEKYYNWRAIIYELMGF